MSILCVCGLHTYIYTHIYGGLILPSFKTSHYISNLRKVTQTLYASVFPFIKGINLKREGRQSLNPRVFFFGGGTDYFKGAIFKKSKS